MMYLKRRAVKHYETPGITIRDQRASDLRNNPCRQDASPLGSEDFLGLFGASRPLKKSLVLGISL